MEIKKNCRTCKYLRWFGNDRVVACIMWGTKRVLELELCTVDCPNYKMADMEVEGE